MALPFIASTLLSMVVPKVVSGIGEKAGWDPNLTGLLATAAGFGVGAAGAGAFSTGGLPSGSIAPAANDVFGSSIHNLLGSGSSAVAGRLAPAAGEVLKSGVGNAVNPSVQTFAANVPGNIKPTFDSAVDAQVIGEPIKAAWSAPDLGAYLSTPQIAHSVYNPEGWTTDGYNPAAGVGKYTSTLDKLKDYAQTDDGQGFLTSAAATFLDYLFADKPEQAPRGGRGGGGPVAPAYPGGELGQKQVVWGFPQSTFKPQPVY